MARTKDLIVKPTARTEIKLAVQEANGEPQLAHGKRMGPTKVYGVHTPTSAGVSDHFIEHTRLSRKRAGRYGSTINRRENENAMKVPFAWQFTVNCVDPSAVYESKELVGLKPARAPRAPRGSTSERASNVDT